MRLLLPLAPLLLRVAAEEDHAEAHFRPEVDAARVAHYNKVCRLDPSHATRPRGKRRYARRRCAAKRRAGAADARGRVAARARAARRASDAAA